MRENAAGDYDVTQGIYAVSSALDEKNSKLEALSERVLRNRIE